MYKGLNSQQLKEMYLDELVEEIDFDVKSTTTDCKGELKND